MKLEEYIKLLEIWLEEGKSQRFMKELERIVLIKWHENQNGDGI